MGLPSAMRAAQAPLSPALGAWAARIAEGKPMLYERSEEHTSELQSQSNLVCRLLLEKKNVPARLFHNRGDGTFEDVTEEAGIGAAIGPVLGVVWADFNGDGLPSTDIVHDVAWDHVCV